MRVFVDTNLWVYRLDQREPHKSSFVSHWLRDLVCNHDIVISTQVLIEVRAVVTRKLKPALSAKDTRLTLQALAAFEVVPCHDNLVLDAHELAANEQLSWFDALIAEAAIRSGCRVLYSEDFNHGQTLADSLRIENPFNQP